MGNEDFEWWVWGMRILNVGGGDSGNEDFEYRGRWVGTMRNWKVGGGG